MTTTQANALLNISVWVECVWLIIAFATLIKFYSVLYFKINILNILDLMCALLSQNTTIIALCYLINNVT